MMCDCGKVENRSTAVCDEAGHGMRPEVDLGTCNACGGCIEIAPEIFGYNESFGFIEIADLDYYNPKLVEEAIRNCPKKSIT